MMLSRATLLESTTAANLFSLLLFLVIKPYFWWLKHDDSYLSLIKRSFVFNRTGNGKCENSFILSKIEKKPKSIWLLLVLLKCMPPPVFTQWILSGDIVSSGSIKKAVPFRALATGAAHHIWKQVVHCSQTLHKFFPTDFSYGFFISWECTLMHASWIIYLI